MLAKLRTFYIAAAFALLSCLPFYSPAHAQGFQLNDPYALQGHGRVTASGPPTLVGCTIVAGSTDTMGTCTASAASGSITFLRTYGTAPSCIVWDQSATSTVSMPVYSVSATAITLTTIISTHVLGWFCMGTASSS